MKNLILIFLLLTFKSYCQTPGIGITDIDGNNYNSVIIGTQEWMKENLNVSKYTDGTVIPQVTDKTQWANLTTGAWCYYNNDPANEAVYGKLYNWYAVAGIWNEASKTDVTQRKKLAPTGYYIPSNAEWWILNSYLGDESILSNESLSLNKLKSTILWDTPNTANTNLSGFSALPAGSGYAGMMFGGMGFGEFSYLGKSFNFWSSSEFLNSTYSEINNQVRELACAESNYSIGGAKTHFFSVRCLKGDSSSFFLDFNISDAFITTWKTSVANEVVSLKNAPQVGSCYSIDWGDGSLIEISCGYWGAQHQYLTAGEHTVTINGIFPYLSFQNQTQLIAVQQWGSQKWTSMANMFMGCTNLNSFPTLAPDLSLCTNMSFMFRDATAFNQSIEAWNVSNVSNMRGMFVNAKAFNQPIEAWNVSNVTDMNGMFVNADTFNQPIGGWNVSKVTNMSYMFASAVSFNQPIGAWDISNVTDMTEMFWNATAYNQSIVSRKVNVINKKMSLYSEPAKLSNNNYDATLIGWAIRASKEGVKRGIRFHGGSSKYYNGLEARNYLMKKFGWVISDGGIDSSAVDTSIVLEAPMVTNLSVCIGGSITLAATALPEHSLLWYTIDAEGNTSFTVPVTNKVGITTYYVAQTFNGSISPKVAVTITVVETPAKPSSLVLTDPSSTTPDNAITSLGLYVGSDKTLKLTVTAVDAFSYNWLLPNGITSTATNSETGLTTSTDNFIYVKFSADTSRTPLFIKVQSVNASGCASSFKASASFSRLLPTAPATIKLTNSALPLPMSGVAVAITNISPYMGTTTELTLTAKPSLTATSYVWELPTGVNVTNSSATTFEGVTSSTSNIITVNFLGVTNSNTYNYLSNGIVPISTNVLRIGVKARNGVGVSLTSNIGLEDPGTISTARLLTLTATKPLAPANLKMYDTSSATPNTAITDISRFIGTNMEFTLTAAVSKLASSYTWEIPSSVTVVAGTDLSSNSIKVTFENVPPGTTSLYIGVKAVNGMGSSVTVNPATLVPTTTSEARLLKVTAKAPTTPGAVVGSLAICSTAATSVNYTVTLAAAGANTYNVTAPVGCTITGGSGNTATIVATASATFTVNYPASFIANTTTQLKSLSIQSVNGFGVGAYSKILKLTNVGSICSSKFTNTALNTDFNVIAYPNPFSDEFSIKSSNGKSFDIEVYDVLGRLIEQHQTESELTKIGVNYLNGKFFLRVIQGENLKTIQVIKR